MSSGLLTKTGRPVIKLASDKMGPARDQAVLLAPAGLARVRRFFGPGWLGQDAAMFRPRLARLISAAGQIQRPAAGLPKPL